MDVLIDVLGTGVFFFKVKWYHGYSDKIDKSGVSRLSEVGPPSIINTIQI